MRKAPKKSIVAIANKMIYLIDLMLTRKESYRDLMVDNYAMSAKKRRAALEHAVEIDRPVARHGSGASQRITSLPQ